MNSSLCDSKLRRSKRVSQRVIDYSEPEEVSGSSKNAKSTKDMKKKKLGRKKTVKLSLPNVSNIPVPTMSDADVASNFVFEEGPGISKEKGTGRITIATPCQINLKASRKENIEAASNHSRNSQPVPVIRSPLNLVGRQVLRLPQVTQRNQRCNVGYTEVFHVDVDPVEATPDGRHIAVPPVVLESQTEVESIKVRLASLGSSMIPVPAVRELKPSNIHEMSAQSTSSFRPSNIMSPQGGQGDKRLIQYEVSDDQVQELRAQGLVETYYID